MNEQVLDTPTRTGASPELLVQLSISFMATRYLTAAHEVGLFEALSQGELTLGALARRLAIPSRTARICVDAMVALGALERDGDRYRNSAAAQRFLSGDDGLDLRPWIRLVDRQSYLWEADFTEAIRAGKGPGFVTRFDPQAQRIFSEGVESLTAGTALALAATYDFDRHRRVLDLGGGTGSFLTPILQRHPGVECGLFELPSVAAIARQHLSSQAAGGRVRVFEGDLLSDPIPAGYDAILIANVVHVFSPKQNHTVFRHIHDSAPERSRLLLVDFWTNSTHTEPVFAALMAGAFLMAGGKGDVYSVDEAGDMLGKTGWELAERRELAAGASLIVADRR